MAIKQALLEMKSIIDSQWKNGMLPHIRFVDNETGYSPDENEWGCKNKTITNIFQTSGITQPPVIGISLYKTMSNIEDVSHFSDELIYILEGVEKFHDFLFKERDPYDESLIAIIHPWESGLDNSPIFDEDNEYARDTLNKLNIKQQIKKRKDLNKVIAEFRPGEKDYEVYGKLIGFFQQSNYDQKKLSENSPFRVQDTLFNTILYEAILSLIKSYKLLSLSIDSDLTAIIAKNEKRADKLYKAMSKKFYDKQTKNYYSYSLNLKKLIKIDTIQSLVTNLLFATDKFETKNIINSYQTENHSSFLSTKSTSPFFDALKYWRGPIWPITNWLVIEQIKKTDIPLAIHYSKSTINIISENFNLDDTYINAIHLMNFNLVFNQFTTPSRNQYKHGWFWDSAFAAIGWINADTQEKDTVYEKIFNEKTKLMKENIDLYKIRKILKEKYSVSLFDEYYVGIETSLYPEKEPIGSEMMSWTAAVYIDLYHFIQNNT